MAPRIDFPHLTRLFEAWDRLDDWKALLERATLPTVATDYAVGPALEHALVDLLGLDWETTEDYEGFYADYREFVRLVRRKRSTHQEQEVIQLHRLWREKGGISGLSADMSLEDVLRKFQGDVSHLIQGGQAMVGALFTLPLDPALLNGGLTNYKLGRGQIMLLATLAVVTGKYDYNAQKLPSTAQAAGTNIKALKWKILPIDWRRGYAILKDMGDNENWWQQFVGLEGHRKFTFCYADGDMHKGFTIASALLEMQGKRKIGEVLKWQQLPIKTTQLPKIKQALNDLIGKAKQKNYDALGAYASWSDKWASGDMFKGFTIASALLEMQGKKKIGGVLKWHELQLKTSDLIFIAKARAQAKPPSTLAIPQRLVGVITGQSLIALENMLISGPASIILTSGSAPKPAASAHAHTSRPHIIRSEVHGTAIVLHSPALVRAATTLIQGQPMITDGGIRGALALAPEIEIIAPVAANDDVEHDLHDVAVSASAEADQLNPSPLADQPIAPGFLGSAHLVPKGTMARQALRIVP